MCVDVCGRGITFETGKELSGKGEKAEINISQLPLQS